MKAGIAPASRRCASEPGALHIGLSARSDTKRRGHLAVSPEVTIRRGITSEDAAQGSMTTRGEEAKTS